MSDAICVFIDGDNIPSNRINIILSEIKTYGRILTCKVYADWSKENTKNWLHVAKNNGIETIQADRISGKNSTDIKMTVDIISTLYEIPYVTLFYIVTSDSDFRHVLPKVKSVGKKINCIGSEANMSLKAMCDIYTDINILYNGYTDCSTDMEYTRYIEDTEHSEHTGYSEYTENTITQNGYKTESSAQKIEKYKKEIEQLLDCKQRVNLSIIKDTLQRKFQFDYREFGYSTMYSFTKDILNDILVITRSENGDCYACKAIKLSYG